jgi:hypothetical protein
MDQPSEYLLVRNTTKAERMQIVEEALGVTDGLCDGCMQGILRMYDPYINGEKELTECNASFHRGYEVGHDEEDKGSCAE